MSRYKKGANAERELIHTLFGMGFSVARVAGSGSSTLPCPDMLAFKKGRALAFECKAHSGKYLNIAEKQMSETIEWAKNARIDFYVGWKLPREGWLFLAPGHFRKNEKNYSISINDARKKGLRINVIAGVQKQLRVKKK